MWEESLIFANFNVIVKLFHFSVINYFYYWVGVDGTDVILDFGVVWGCCCRLLVILMQKCSYGLQELNRVVLCWVILMNLWMDRGSKQNNINQSDDWNSQFFSKCPAQLETDDWIQVDIINIFNTVFWYNLTTSRKWITRIISWVSNLGSFDVSYNWVFSEDSGFLWLGRCLSIDI